MVPAPPEIPCERPKALLRRCNEAIECAGLADDRRDLRGDLELVNRLLAAGASAQAVDERGRSALLGAVYSRHADVAKALMLAGADVNRKDAEANSPFLLAAATGIPPVEAMKIALLSISGHKIYGPKGIGSLYVRRKPRVRITASVNSSVDAEPPTSPVRRLLSR